MTTPPSSPSRRTLILMRHGKSAYPDVADHDRPLAPRGRRDAPAVGRWLRAAGHLPDGAVVSSALRTRETWQLVSEQFEIDPPAVIEEQIYGATPNRLLESIRRVEPAWRTLLVVGHDPAVPELARTLPAEAVDAAGFENMRLKFPTAAVAIVEFAGNWDRLEPGTARLVGFIRPRDLHTDDEGGQASGD